MPTINKALVKAGFSNIKSIVTTFDNGGDSGRIRTDERGNVLAYSDYWRSLISLWKDGKQKNIWEEMLRYRDGKGRNFGNTFFMFMAEKCKDLSKVDSLFSSLVKANLKGEVIPVSLKPSNIKFKTKSNKVYLGEKYLDDLRMSCDQIKKIWLEPKVKANIEAINVLKTSDFIIICPGSIYGSILSNFLPTGTINAFNQTKAKKILITNLVSMANEASELNIDEYINIFNKYLGKKDHFDLIIAPDFSKIPKPLLHKIIDNYSLEHSALFNFKNQNKKIQKHNIVSVDKTNMRLRHSEDKLAKLFKKLLR